MSQRAVFLDRDNTIIEDPGFINDPDAVSLLPGAAEAIRMLNEAGFVVVIATNQSGIARGLITEEQLAEVHERVRELLLEQGARVDAIYHCPYLNGPQAAVEEYRKASDLRKPKPGMLLRAADELDVVLEESWMVGDGERDILAGERAGCRTVLVDPGGRNVCDTYRPEFVVPSLLEAARLILEDPPPTRTVVPEEQSQLPAVGIPVDVQDPVDVERTTVDATPAAGGKANSQAVLEEIRDLLRRRERRRSQEDFSVMRLLATLAQMLAVVAAVLGLVAIFSDPVVAIARFLLAAFLQLLTLTAVVTSQRN